jgi:hypothetical protein
MRTMRKCDIVHVTGLNKAVLHTIHAKAVKSTESYTGANPLGLS